MPDGPATYFKYDLCLGSITGLISISYDTNPGDANPLAIPVNFRITWNSLQFQSGFRGDSSFDAELIEKGYTATTGGSVGVLEFIKNAETPECALLEVFTPINNSIADFGVICPGNSPTPTPTPTGTPEPTPTIGPTPTAPCIDCEDLNKKPTPTPSPT